MAEAEKKQDKVEKTEKKDKHTDKDKIKKQAKPEEEFYESLVRIFGYDIPGNKNVFSGLIRIKGISWATSNAVCIRTGIKKNTKISELSKEDIAKIEKILPTLNVPDYMKNRRKDPETGETKHYYGSDLDILRDFDIKRLKKMKSYKGVRHSLGQPVRGQRTRSHFRKQKIVKAGKAGAKNKKPSDKK